MNLLHVRMLLSLLGFLLALVAILLEDRRITWVAIAVLAIAFAMRLTARRNPPADRP